MVTQQVQKQVLLTKYRFAGILKNDNNLTLILFTVINFMDEGLEITLGEDILPPNLNISKIEPLFLKTLYH